MMTRGLRIAFVGVVLVLDVVAVPSSGPAHAAEGDRVNSFFGTFHSEIKIDVPSYHGLEPALSVTYNSASGNGLLGVGWSLEGIDFVERVGGGGRGAPRYEASDTFLLAGQQLIACTAGSTSPSCLAGGSHSTKNESYQRILFDLSANTWRVTAKDGTVRSYGSVHTTDVGTFRWGLTRVADLVGNSVTYDWWCDPSADCYPDAVRYNGVVVRFYREARPDPITYATGRSLAHTRFRVRSIDVTVGGVRSRVYRLDYGSSGGSAVGGALPVANNAFSPERNWGAYDAVAGWTSSFSADVTGDGKADLVYLDDAAAVNGWRVMRSLGTSYAEPENWAAFDPVLAWAQFWVRDMNGDGKADLLYLDDAYTVNGYRVMLSTGSSFLPPQNWGAYDAINNWAGFWAIDVNADDKTDLLYLDDAYAVNGWRVMLSTGTGFTAPQNWGAYDASSGWGQTRLADVTGDGRPDLVYLDDAYSTNGYRVMVNQGTSLAAPVNWAAYDPLHSWSAWWFADLNGDGKADMLYLDDAFDATGYRVMVSTGNSFSAPVTWGVYDSVAGWAQTWVTDVTGDGKADLLYLDNAFTFTGYRVMASTGTSFSVAATWASYDTLHSWSAFWVSDATGDGLPDLVYLDDAYPTNGYRVKQNLSDRASGVVSAASGRSILQQVTPFGRDAAVDAAGAVSGGTSLTPSRFSTAAANNTFASEQGWGAYDQINNWQGFFTADVTGDGREDLVYLDDAYTVNGWRVMPSRGTSFGPPANWGAYDPILAWAQFWVRDMNGDGKADLLYLDDAYAVNGYRVMLSTGSSFLPPQNWGAYDAINNWAGFWAIDVNADDKTDLLYLDDAYAVNGWRVMLSTGTGFTAPQNWGAYDASSGWGQTRLADVTGDGRPDLVYLDDAYSTNGYRVMVNQGTSLAAPVNWAAYDPLHSWSAWWFADLNGDGKADMLYLDDAFDAFGYRVMLSTGRSFAAPQSWGPYDSVNSWAQTWIVDVNGDGRQDLLYLDNHFTTNGYRVMLGSAAGFAAPQNWASYDSLHDWTTFRIADVTGDGLADLVYLDDAYPANGYRVKRNQATRDLVTLVDNGMGGTTAIGYEPSTNWSNTFMPAGLVAQTVASLTSSDGRGTAATTSYSYQGGLWSSVERRFLGFRKVTSVVDAAGNTVETYYHQHIGCIAKPETTYLRNASGQIYSFTSYQYQESSAPPYTSLMTERWEYECNLGQTCRRVVTQLDYDQLGNILATREWGDYDVDGDEVTTVRGYFPNLARYIATKPAYENVYAGIGTGGALLKQTLNYYDGATSYTIAPATAGKVTQQRRWNSQTGSYVTTGYGYDEYGNLVSETDELGRERTYEFDAVHHVNRTKRCDALGHCIRATFDYGFGALLTEIDANGNLHEVTYDSLGRIASETNPGMGTVTWQYLDWGNPSVQRIRQTLPDGSPDGLWAEQYVDGAMRRYRWVREGGMERRQMYSGMTDRVWKESAWYLPASEPARYQVYAYDGAGRMMRNTNPDGTYAEVSYGNGLVQRTNEVGEVKVEVFDGAGRLIKVVEYEGVAAHVTHTRRDALGRVVLRIDAVGHISTTTWDSLDRRVSSCDPDTGCTQYGYDDAGSLVFSVDAKQQVISMVHDAVGRPISKNGSDGTVVTWTYDEPGRGAIGGDRPTSIQWATGSDAFTYDAAGHVAVNTRCVLGECKTQRWAYDGLGRQIQTMYPTGEVVTQTYDAAGRLAAVPGYVNAMTWNAREQLVSMTYANGVTHAYSYDAQRAALTSSTVSAGSTLYQANYGYDAASRVTSSISATDPLLNNSYSYDALGRLVRVSGAQNETFSYDAVGNITFTSLLGAYQYGDPSHVHAVTAAGGSSYVYDANGNLLSGGGRTFGWDIDNRLTTVTTDDVTVSFTYDPSGNRIARVAQALTAAAIIEREPPQISSRRGGLRPVRSKATKLVPRSKVVASALGTTRVFGKLFELQPDGSPVSHIYAGPMEVARKVGTSSISFLHQDRLGSIQLVTSATGAVSRSYEYSAFGRTIGDVGSAANTRGFQGHETDTDLGLIYMNARYYDARLGRFLSADTLVPDSANPQALNRYAFAYNNPICNTDPTGHVPVVAALVTAVTVNGPVAWVAFAFTAAGYATKDPLLMTIGSVLTGFTSGATGNLLGNAVGSGILGASVAALTSPLSPLDPQARSVLGWVYSAATFAGEQLKATQKIEDKVAYGKYLLARSGGSSLLGDPIENSDAAAATVGEIFDHIGSPDPKTARKILELIRKNKDYKVGMLGRSAADASPWLDRLFGWIPSMRLHGIIHDGYGFAGEDFNAGPGFLGPGGWFSELVGLGRSSPLAGQVEGLYNTGNFSLLGGLKAEATNRRFRR